MFDDLIEYCELFKKDYIHKIKLLCAFVYNTESKEGSGHFVDLYLTSHNMYYKIKIDIAKFNDKTKETEMSVSIRKLDEFCYFRIPKNIISIDPNEITFPELKYQVYESKPDVIINYIDIKNSNNFIIKTNLFTINNTKKVKFVDIDLTKAKETSRNELVNKLFTGKEKEKIMEIFIDNDKYQEKCYKREKERKW